MDKYKLNIFLLLIPLLIISCKNNHTSNQYQEEEVDIQTEQIFSQLDDKSIAYNENIYHLEKEISENIKIYKNKDSKILHAKAVVDTIKTDITSNNKKALIQDADNFTSFDLSGVEYVNSTSYQYSFYGYFGYYTDYNDNIIARQTIDFDDLPIPEGSIFEEVTINLFSYAFTNITPRNGPINISLVEPSYNPGTSNHFDLIQSGQIIFSFNYDTGKQSNSNTITNQSILNNIQNYVDNNDLHLGIRAAGEYPYGVLDELQQVDLLIQYQPPVSAPTTPVLSSPSDGSNLTHWPSSSRLEWEESDGDPTEYEINIYTSSSYNETFTTSNEYFLTYSLDLDTGQTFNWRVRAKNSEGTSSWSEVRTFNVIPGVSVSGPTQLTQQDGIAWFTAEIEGGSPPYEYEWESKVGSGSWNPFGSNETVSITYSPTIHWFYVQVTIIDSNDNSVTSSQHSMQFYHQ